MEASETFVLAAFVFYRRSVFEAQKKPPVKEAFST